MPSRDDRLTAADRARLRRARKRAGVAPPVRGESVKDKARVAVQGRARSDFEALQYGKLPPQEFAKRVRASLTPAEQRDLGSYSRVESERTQARLARQNLVGPLDRAAGIALSFNPKSKGLGAELRSFVHGARAAKDTLLDRDASRREKVEAAGHIGMVAGLGGGMGVPGKSAAPKPEFGGDDILKALPEARRLRAEQQKGYRAERAARAGKAAEARAAAGGGEAGQRAAKAQFKGELPKLSFDTLAKRVGEADSATRAVYQPHIDRMKDQIAAHPSMKGQYSITSTQDALDKVLNGVTPTKSEIRSLEAVFGDEAVDYFKWRTTREKMLKALNLPRSLQATFDLSRALRQDIMVLPRHPKMWARNWSTMLRAAKNPEKAKDIMRLIHEDPWYDDAIESRLALTEIGGATKKLEEDMIGVEYAEKIPVLGAGVRFSNRAYAVGGSALRLNLYKMHMMNAERAGKVLTTKEKRQLASVINASTGRGNMGFQALEQAAPLLTMGLFSPRLIASRVAFMNPYWYAMRLSGPARREAMESMALFVAAGTSVLWMADKIPGVDVGVDPRSADFGKIRFGDTRIDIWGGFQQYVVNFDRMRRGEKVSSMTGEVTEQKPSETAIDFLRNKLAPLPGYAWNAADGETSGGQPFDRAIGAGKLFAPLNWQNTVAAGQEDGPAGAATAFGLGFVGIGTNTYGADAKTVADAKQRMRGPKHVRDHEDRMKSLRQELKRRGREEDPEAVKASRFIRNMDLAKKRAEKKKGDRLSSEEKARLAFTFYKRMYPEHTATWEARFSRNPDESEWQNYYEKFREHIARKYKRYGLNLDGSKSAD